MNKFNAVTLQNKAFGNVLMRYDSRSAETAFVEGFKKFIRNYMTYAMELLEYVIKDEIPYTAPIVYATSPEDAELLSHIYNSDTRFSAFRECIQLGRAFSITVYNQADKPDPKSNAHVFIFSSDTTWLDSHLFKISQTQWNVEYYTFMEDK